MIRRVRRKTVVVKVDPAQDCEAKENAKDGLPSPLVEDTGCVEDERCADWIAIPDDTLVGMFGLLNYRDRANLASVCQTWRRVAASPSLWTSLDLRAHTLDSEMASSLASRCKNLKRLRFRGAAPASAIINLKATGLRDLSGDVCRDLSDATLSMIAARHEHLESLQLGPDCDRLTSDAVRVVAVCCPRLKRLRLSGLRDIDNEAIVCLLKKCPNLTELGFLDCLSVDEGALSSATNLRLLSLAGSRNINWSIAAQVLGKLLNLEGIDASRSEITAPAVSHLLTSSRLKVIAALNCPTLEDNSDAVVYPSGSKVLLARFTDVVKGLEALFPKFFCPEARVSIAPNVSFVTCSSGQASPRRGEESNANIMEWVEWVLSHALLRIAESNTPGLDNFWLKQGTAVMLSLLKSHQEDVQEKSATALATFVVIDDENATVDKPRAEAVMNGGGIASLLDLAKSCREGVQAEAAKAIANLSVNVEVAKTVANEGGIRILAALAKSPNRWVAEEAAGGLWNLSVGEEHKGAIAQAGAIEALVELAFKWPAGGEGVLERAAGALANLAADDKCSMEVATAGGVHALVLLARFCKHEGVQEQAARALANLAAHGDSNGNNAAVGRETGALEALVQLTCSGHEGVRQEAAGALWNLSFDDRNREAIAAAGGVEALMFKVSLSPCQKLFVTPDLSGNGASFGVRLADSFVWKYILEVAPLLHKTIGRTVTTLCREKILVALAQSCSSGSQGLQERAAGALWGLSVSEANSIAIGREGGVAPLVALARSDSEDVHETAAGALWNLAFNPGNAWKIVEEDGVPALVHLCSFSHSKMARFMAALALAYMFDGRMDDVAAAALLCESNTLMGVLDNARKLAMRNIDSFVQAFSEQSTLQLATVSWAPSCLTTVAEAARILEAGHLRCSGAEVGRFVAMLKNGSPVLRGCAAFALLQFTMPGGRHAMHHATLLQNACAGRVLRAVAAAATAPLQAKVFSRIVLRNLEVCLADTNV